MGPPHERSLLVWEFVPGKSYPDKLALVWAPAPLMTKGEAGHCGPGPVSASGSFSSGKNGLITESLTANPPSAGDFSCPSGQGLVFGFVSHTSISIRTTPTASQH